MEHRGKRRHYSNESRRDRKQEHPLGRACSGIQEPEDLSSIGGLPHVARHNLLAGLTARCDSRILMEERNKEYDLPQVLQRYLFAACICPTTTDMIR